MTMFGKMLVFLNLVIGLAMLSWAVGLYTQKLDWIDRTDAAGEKIEGEITKLKAEIDVLTVESRVATYSWGAANAALDAAEKDRDQRKQVLDQRLQWARTGDPMGRGFFKDELLPGLSLLDVEKLGAPIIGPDGKPLRGSDTLAAGIEMNNKDTQAALMAINTLRVEQDKLQRDEKLLQAKVDRAAIFYDNLANELRYLEAFEINWFEQLGTVQRRLAQLQKRVEETKQP